MLTLSIYSLLDLFDTHIVDTVITGDSINNITVSSISTSRTEPTMMLITPLTTNVSPTPTVEGTSLVALDNGTVVSVPEGSS